jgi:hypothetical protein
MHVLRRNNFHCSAVLTEITPTENRHASVESTEHGRTETTAPEAYISNIIVSKSYLCRRTKPRLLSQPISNIAAVQSSKDGLFK